MATSSSSSTIHYFLIILSILLIITPEPATSSYPTALVLPVTKHPSTLLYTTQIQQRTPLIPLEVVLDLNTQFLWVDDSTHADKHLGFFNSSTYRQSSCNASECSTTTAHSDGTKTTTVLPNNNNKPKCSSKVDICTVTAWSTAFKTTMVGNLSQDTISLPSTDGITQGDMVSTPSFVFSATRSLAGFTQGIAGLGRNKLAFPTQLASRFKLSRKFAICLPPSNSLYPHSLHRKGVIFFGDGPYALNPGIDVSKLLIYTPLIPNPTTQPPGSIKNDDDDDEYFFGVKSIEVNGKRVKLNSTLLARSGKGRGTKISTVNPYTIMESSIYKSFVKLFVKEAKASNLTRVRPVDPFQVCYSMKTTSDGFRPAMPTIDMILHTKKVFWRVFETNSMVLVNRGEVACLGFLEAGDDEDPGASIVIGGHQLEDNLVQIDLEESKLGFTSTLLFRQTSCADFNFNPHPDP